ncbi:unnamed protein product, partial [Nippostrongylus brasiliensis]|uniref:POU domain, class 6, transcription factor 2 n=1 Tax=Nippostrongylus brasiliensis TaxID=27835 RepID=A0A0N4YEM0_NIPBR
IASLASQLLAATQNLSSTPLTTTGDTQTTTAGGTNSLTIASLASQLLPTTSNSLVNQLIGTPGLQMLNGQLPVINELCNTEQQQLDSADHNNLLSMTYDQLQPTLLKTEPME